MRVKLICSVALMCIAAVGVFSQSDKSSKSSKTKIQVKQNEDVDASIRLLDGKVVQVSDGDLINIQTKDGKTYSIRLQAIDAPDEKQNYFKKSRNRLSDLTFDKDVKVIVNKKDLSGHYLGTVYLDGRDVGLMQIENGLAWHFKAVSYDQTTDERKRYAAAEQKARSERAGLWEDKDPVAPWDFRGDVKIVETTPNKPPAVSNSATGKTYILGPRGGCYYLNESGEKVYVRDKSLCAKPQ